MIASVIMVIAITSLVAYWFGVQSVAESRTSDMYSDSLRIAESLLSPGVPSNWTAADIGSMRQIGLEENSSAELDKGKIAALGDWAKYPNPDGPPPPNYTAVGKILRATGDYYITIRQTDGALNYSIGKPPALNATEVVIAHRGAVLNDSGSPTPMSISVYLWR